jgi:hypothetical protein
MGEMSDGKRSSHHYRRTPKQLNAGKRALMAVYPKIQKCKNFEKLHDLVKKITDTIEGLGELYIYDAAHIIGTQLGFHPQKSLSSHRHPKGCNGAWIQRGIAIPRSVTVTCRDSSSEGV